MSPEMGEEIPFCIFAFMLILCYQVHDKIRSGSHNKCWFFAIMSTPPPPQKQADFLLSKWWTPVLKALNSRLLLKRL